MKADLSELQYLSEFSFQATKPILVAYHLSTMQIQAHVVKNYSDLPLQRPH